MHRVRRVSWLVLVFGVAFLFFDATTIVDRRDYSAAVSAYVRNPTPQNGALLRTEGRRNELVKAGDAAVEAAIVTVLAFGAFAIYRLFRKREKTRE